MPRVDTVDCGVVAVVPESGSAREDRLVDEDDASSLLRFPRIPPSVRQILLTPVASFRGRFPVALYAAYQDVTQCNRTAPRMIT
jgi:hypothetical protein